jgi:hypothetical protein
MELGEMLLESAADDFETPDEVRKLLRGLREVRMAKLRKGVEVLDAGGGVKMNGVGGMEVGEARAFITGVIDNLRSAARSDLENTCIGLALTHHIGKSGRHASNREKIERLRKKKGGIQHLRNTMKTMKWICNSFTPSRESSHLDSWSITTINATASGMKRAMPIRRDCKSSNYEHC